MEGVGEKNGNFPYLYSRCYYQQRIIMTYQFWGGQVGFSKERAIELYHNLGLTKAKTIMHLVEGRALLVVEAQQHYGLKP
jgi:ABC-type antimicrobial peptide transport system ATPase subunit